MSLIKGQKWEKMLRRRELMHIDACKEFYANLTMFHYKKKEISRSRVRGVEIEFDSIILASILGIPGDNGICEYIKEVWEESKYTKPLEITKRSGENRRRDDEEVAPAENEEVNPECFDWEAVIDEVEIEREDVNEEVGIQGEHMKKEVEADESRSGEKFFDAENEVHEFAEVSEDVPDVPTPTLV
ncbi:hypothetical protein Dimus_029133 [Dionaea muscipula]